jgi:hypothetical protein
VIKLRIQRTLPTATVPTSAMQRHFDVTPLVRGLSRSAVIVRCLPVLQASTKCRSFVARIIRRVRVLYAAGN